ncbi:DUF2569 domain-containing protein [Paenibacillus sp. FJAT-26967]|uniref:DUF2569 domain-containing protein n=1 Tax=Paenibacillus sp. FJAT-26967 TaxID=1729690 RepID=UPI0008382DDA|nr:DUF2569 domain-containing protein [Paenibacillus sp. FJAT-26967]
MEVNLPESKMNERPMGVAGLGGWLVLVQIGLVVSIFVYLAQIVNYLVPVLTPDIWDALTSPSSEAYHPLWGFIIVFESLANVLLLLLSVYILLNFYRKKRRVPRLMIMLYSFSLAAVVIDSVLLNQIPIIMEVQEDNGIRDIVKMAVLCAIWIPYFMKSERVANTFVK